MSVRAISSTGDWTFGSGRQNYIRDIDEIRQNLLTRLLMWRGDCFFAEQQGVDYLNFFDIGTKDLLDMDIKRVILQTVGIIRLNEYVSTLDPVTRNISISGTAETFFGTMELADLEEFQEVINPLELARQVTPNGFTETTPDGFIKVVFVRN
jgi:hypothetical protein